MANKMQDPFGDDDIDFNISAWTDELLVVAEAQCLQEYDAFPCMQETGEGRGRSMEESVVILKSSSAVTEAGLKLPPIVDEMSTPPGEVVTDISALNASIRNLESKSAPYTEGHLRPLPPHPAYLAPLVGRKRIATPIVNHVRETSRKSSTPSCNSVAPMPLTS